MAFSENGYWLALALAGQSTVEIWDLRKMAATKTIDVGARVDSVAFDYSGQFLATAGPAGVTVQQNVKDGSARRWIEPFKSGVAAVATAWGARAESLVAVGRDGVVKVLA